MSDQVFFGRESLVGEDLIGLGIDVIEGREQDLDIVLEVALQFRFEDCHQVLDCSLGDFFVWGIQFGEGLFELRFALLDHADEFLLGQRQPFVDHSVELFDGMIFEQCADGWHAIDGGLVEGFGDFLGVVLGEVGRVLTKCRDAFVIEQDFHSGDCVCGVEQFIHLRQAVDEEPRDHDQQESTDAEGDIGSGLDPGCDRADSTVSPFEAGFETGVGSGCCDSGRIGWSRIVCGFRGAVGCFVGSGVVRAFRVFGRRIVIDWVGIFG